MTLPLSRERSLDALYFRSADRLRAAGCANALGREGLSVVMQCEREALLDHYCDMVLGELRNSHDDVRVEAYFPESTESLMARFNEILARHSVQDALKAGRIDAPLRVWVVHDAGRVAGAEIQLLARLIHNFPGANVRALLLVPQAAAESASSSALAAFGRRLLRWDIELPSPAQVDAALEAARYDDREAPVRQLLRLSGLLPGVAQPQPAAMLLAQRASASATPAVQGNAIKENATRESPELTELPAVGRAAASMRHKLIARLKGWRALSMSLPLARKTAQRAGSPRKPAASGALARIPEKAQGAIVVAGALLAFSTLAMYWLQPEAFGRSTKTVAKATPPAAAAVAPAATAGAAPAVVASTAGSAASGVAAVSSRLGSSPAPWWRSRENVASVKTP